MQHDPHDPHDITERLAYLDNTEGLRRADRIVNGLMVAALLLTGVMAWVWL